MRKIFGRILRIGLYFGSTPYELRSFMKGIGSAEIKENEIIFKKYPFRPSQVYPKGSVHFADIEECHINTGPLTIKVKNELLFISKEKETELKTFALRNKIRISERAENWTWICEPFLDTEFTEGQKEETINHLIQNGFTKEEIIELRKEVGQQMNKYNFDTMFWDWVSLSLCDVLIAMQAKYDKEKFKNFYRKAMDIELRSDYIPPAKN
jgi:hypothetical protein